MMVLRLISDSIPIDERPELPCAAEPGVCCLTGEEGDSIPRKHLITPSFCDGDLMRRPDSESVGVHAWRALRYRPERMASWVVLQGRPFEKLDRIGVRARVIAGVNHPEGWAGYATTSYKKHGALRAPFNTGTKQFWRFENETVDCTDRERLESWWAQLNRYIRAGISRPALESGKASSYAWRAAGVPTCLEFEAWARDKYRAPLYKFLCYLLPSIKELKEEEKEQKEEKNDEKQIQPTTRRGKNPSHAPLLPGFE